MSDTKKIWGRIGMTFHLTEEEFHTLQEGGDDAAELIFQKVKSGEALLDGDTYFPSPEDPRRYWEFSGDIELCL